MDSAARQEFTLCTHVACCLGHAMLIFSRADPLSLVLERKRKGKFYFLYSRHLTFPPPPQHTHGARAAAGQKQFDFLVVVCV